MLITALSSLPFAYSLLHLQPLMEHQIAKPQLDSAEGNPEKQTGKSDVEQFGTKSGKCLQEALQSQPDIQMRLHQHFQEHQIASSTLDSEEGNPEKQTSMSDVEQVGTNSGVYLKEALQMQLDVQRRLHEQLEDQRNLLMKIEEQETAETDVYLKLQ